MEIQDVLTASELKKRIEEYQNSLSDVENDLQNTMTRRLILTDCIRNFQEKYAKSILSCTPRPNWQVLLEYSHIESIHKTLNDELAEYNLISLGYIEGTRIPAIFIGISEGNANLTNTFGGLKVLVPHLKGVEIPCQDQKLYPLGVIYLNIAEKSPVRILIHPESKTAKVVNSFGNTTHNYFGLFRALRLAQRELASTYSRKLETWLKLES